MVWYLTNAEPRARLPMDTKPPPNYLPQLGDGVCSGRSVGVAGTRGQPHNEWRACRFDLPQMALYGTQ